MRNTPLALLGCLLTAVTLSAQTEVVLPSALATTMGSTANRIPHARHQTKYQQVFLGSEIAGGGSFVMTGLSLRMDEQFVGSAGTYDYTIRLGPTAKDHTNLTASFAGNFSGPATTVFSGSFNLPASAGAGGVNSWLFTIPFATEYTHPAGANLLVEWINSSAVSNSSFLDYCFGDPGCTTASCYAFDPNATTATSVFFDRGLIMRFTGHPPQSPPPCFEEHLGTSLGMGDDQTVARPLGFSFPFAGGSTTDISICSNGFVWLDGVQTSNDFSNSVAEFLGSVEPTPRLAACWRDFNPVAAGSGDVYLKTFADRAVITWNNLVRYNGTVPMTVQLQMLADGSFYVFFDPNFDLTGGTASEGRSLIGIKCGTGVVADPGNTDYSTALPISTATSTAYEFFGDSANFDLRGRCIRFARNGGGGYDVSFRTDCGGSSIPYGVGCPAGLPATMTTNVPTIGAPLTWDVVNVPSNAIAARLQLGVGSLNLPLDFLGAIGCFAYTTSDLGVRMVVSPPTASLSLTVPASPYLLGTTLFSQAVLVSNTLAITTSNGVRVTIGKN